jgi:hypothetical protein
VGQRSKTRSGSSAPPEPTFFVDRDLGRRFVEILRAGGFAVEAHHDHFEDRTPDEVWLREVARRGWVALTHDAKIRYTSRIREVILEVGVRVIVLRGKAPAPVLADAFVRSRAVVRRFLQRHPQAAMAKFSASPRGADRPGRLEVWLTSESSD